MSDGIWKVIPGVGAIVGETEETIQYNTIQYHLTDPLWEIVLDTPYTCCIHLLSLSNASEINQANCLIQLALRLSSLNSLHRMLG